MNLVAACKDCNAGKTSSSPDAPLVADVSEDAKRWHERLKYAMAQIENDLIEKNIVRNDFEAFWNGYTIAGKPVPKPLDWRDTVDRWMALSVPWVVLTEAIQVAMGKNNITHDARWKYMCGVVWRTIDKARTAIEAEATPEPQPWCVDEEDDTPLRDYQDGWNDGYDYFAVTDVPHRVLMNIIDGTNVRYARPLRWVA
jgi:hypothetical protein